MKIFFFCLKAYNMFYASDFKTTSSRKTLKNVVKKSQNKGSKAENSWKHYFNGLLDEYCQCGSLHGLKYIREPSIPRAERLLWLVIIMTCLYTSWNVVINLYLQGADHSFSLDIHPQSTPIWEIPFPAVAVCSNYPIRKSVFDIAKEVDNKKYRFYSKMVCPNKMAFGIEHYDDIMDEEFFEFILKAAIPCKDLILNCYWRGRKRDCCTYFKPLLTPFGYCYIFNSLPGRLKYKNFRPPPGIDDRVLDDYSFWSMTKGYPKRDGKQAKLVRPFWSEFAGPNAGLMFDLVDVREEWQENCSGDAHGFQLAVFPPYENFETETIITIPKNEHSYIKLNPSLIHAEDSLRSILIEDRECVFEDEVRLDYFNYYTQPICRMECYLQHALPSCGCVIFSARRILGTFNHPYCNESQYGCLSKELSNLLITPLVKPKQVGGYDKCACVPACSSLRYDLQTSYQQIITPTTLPLWADDYNESAEEDFARVSVFFHEQQFSTIDRKRTSTLGNFLGSCGGLLGLFLGFSFMSLFEIIYFALIRPVNRLITSYIQNR